MTTSMTASGVKPGIKSTEFYGKMVIQLAVILNMLFDLGIEIDDQTSLTIVGGLEAIYSIARGVAKSGSKETANITHS